MRKILLLIIGTWSLSELHGIDIHDIAQLIDESLVKTTKVGTEFLGRTTETVAWYGAIIALTGGCASKLVNVLSIGSLQRDNQPQWYLTYALLLSATSIAARKGHQTIGKSDFSFRHEQPLNKRVAALAATGTTCIACLIATRTVYQLYQIIATG